MLMKLFSALFERLISAGYSLTDLAPAYLYNTHAFLSIPLDKLKRIDINYRAGVTVCAIEIWHPYLAKETEIGTIYLTEAELKEVATGEEFRKYKNSLINKQNPMSKDISDNYKGERSICTQMDISIEDIFVMSDNELVVKLNSSLEDHTLPRYLDKKDPNYSTQLAAAVNTWMDVHVRGLGSKKLSLVERSKKLISENYTEIEETPRKRIASWINPDHNKKK